MPITPEDRRLAQEALQAKQVGRRPTRDQAAALKRVTRVREEEEQRRACEAIPQKLWREWSGLQTKQINEQAARYGIPFGGAVINLREVVYRLHRFLAENAILLARDEEETDTGASEALEKWRHEKYLIARIERQRLEQQLLPRDAIHEGLTQIASILRRCGETLGRSYGLDAQTLFEEALDDCQRVVEGLLTAMPAAAPPADDPPVDS